MKLFTRIFKNRKYRINYRRAMKDESGQGMTEYILILGLIAIAAVGIIWAFGDNIYNTWNWANGKITDPSQTSDNTTATTKTKNKWD